MSATRRHLVIAGWVLGALAVGTALALSWFLGTRSGARWLLDRVVTRAPGTLAVADVRGSMLGPLVLTGVRYRADGFDLDVERILLEAKVAWRGRFEVTIARLHVDSVRVVTRPTTGPDAPTTAAPDSLPDVRLGFALRAHDVLIRGVRWASVGPAIADTTIAPVDLDRIAMTNVIWERKLAFERLTIEGPSASAVVEGWLEPYGDYPLDLSVDWNAQLPATPPLAGGGRIRGTARRLDVEQRISAPVAASLQAELSDPLGDAAAEAAIEWQPLALRTWNASWPDLSVAGRAKGSGWFGGYRIEASVSHRGGGLPAGAWQLAASGDTLGARIERLAGKVRGASVVSSGTVRWQRAFAWDFALAARGLDPSMIEPAWPGAIALAGRSSGSLDEHGVAGEVALDTIAGTLRGAALAGELAARFDGRGGQLHEARIRWGGLNAIAHGGWGDVLDLAYEVEAADLSRVGAWLNDTVHVNGAFAAHGRVTGTPRAPRVSVEMTGDSLRFESLSAARLSLTANVQPARGEALELDIDGADVRSGGLEISRVRLAALGTWSEHVAALDAWAGQDSVHAELAGGFVDARWSGEVRALAVTNALLGIWSNPRPARLNASATAVELDSLCIGSGDAHACAAAHLEAQGGWRIDASFERLPLALFQDRLPMGLEVEGVLDGQVRARAERGAPLIADAALAARDGRLHYVSADGRMVDSGIERALARFQAGREGASARIDVTLQGLAEIAGDLSMPRYAESLPIERQPIEGRLTLSASDLGIVRVLIPEVEPLGGRLEGDVRYGGTVGAATADGTLRLLDGSADVPGLGLRLREVWLAIESHGNAATIDGGLRSGRGRLAVGGTASLGGEEGPAAELTVRGDSLQVINIRDYRAIASPSLRVAWKSDRTDVEGEIVVPEARITPRDRNQAALVSPDIVLEESDADSTPMVSDLYARVRLSLEKNIAVDAFGLIAQPTGSVIATARPNGPIAGSGELSLEGGRYRVYGQELKIDRGRLFFGGGPIENPGLDLRASRSAAGDIVAGVEVRGTLSAPIITLFSEPVMPDREILAYIMFGRPLEDVTSSESGLVTEAATSLGLEQGSLLVGRIGSQLGLDEARIESKGAPDASSLMLGTYLSPKLYLSYGIGLFDPVSTFRIRYLLSKRWTLEVESSSEDSADLRYSVER